MDGNSTSLLLPGFRVRMKANPGRVGIITGKTRIIGNRLYYQVKFIDDTSFELQGQLEQVNDEEEDPLELLKKGRIGQVKDLRGNLTYIRLNGHLADLIYSLNTTNTHFMPFQFKPVLNFLDSPSNGILIADEVGLGKTIEAGLIWTELRARYESRKIMVLCPAMLQEKWKYELYDKFGIDAEIVKAQEILDIFSECQTGRRLEFALICSMQGIRPQKGWDSNESEQNDWGSRLARFLIDFQYEEKLIDLLVIDEAHYLRNPLTMTAKLGKNLRKVADQIVLLSATPIHLKNLDLFNLLSLIDEDTFQNQLVFQWILEANIPILQARDMIWNYNSKKDIFIDVVIKLRGFLNQAEENLILRDNRQLKELISDLPKLIDYDKKDFKIELCDRLGRLNLLNSVITRTRKREVSEFRIIRDPHSLSISLTNVESSFYQRVTDLIKDYAKKNIGFSRFLTVMPQRQMSSSMPAALESWLTKTEFENTILYEDLGLFEIESNNLGPLIKFLVDNVSKLGDLNSLYKNDSKYIRLKQLIKRLLLTNSREKIVIFSYFKATIRYLEKRLKLDNFSCVSLTGDIGDNKYTILNLFEKRDEINILLSTEVASEGIDLQFSRILINFDLPWNPMKVEQRIGRIDRIGQKAKKIKIYNLYYENTIDDKIFHRLYQRLEIFKRALGDIEIVLGDHIKKMTKQLFLTDLTIEQQEELIDQTAKAVENMRIQEEILEEEASKLVAHGDYILHQVHAAQELQRIITGNDIWIFVRDFFNYEYEGCEFRQIKENELLFDVRLSDKAKFDLEQYIILNQLWGKTNLTNVSQNITRCLFENKTYLKLSNTQDIINQGD